MNTFGTMAALVRPAAETSLNRGGSDVTEARDEAQDAFKDMLGALRDERAALKDQHAAIADAKADARATSKADSKADALADRARRRSDDPSEPTAATESAASRSGDKPDPVLLIAAAMAGASPVPGAVEAGRKDGRDAFQTLVAQVMPERASDAALRTVSPDPTGAMPSFAADANALAAIQAGVTGLVAGSRQRVAVVRLETHFAPVATGVPAIASAALSSAAGSDAAAQGAAAALESLAGALDSAAEKPGLAGSGASASFAAMGASSETTASLRPSLVSGAGAPAPVVADPSAKAADQAAALEAAAQVAGAKPTSGAAGQIPLGGFEQDTPALAAPGEPGNTLPSAGRADPADKTVAAAVPGPDPFGAATAQTSRPDADAQQRAAGTHPGNGAGTIGELLKERRDAATGHTSAGPVGEAAPSMAILPAMPATSAAAGGPARQIAAAVAAEASAPAAVTQAAGTQTLAEGPLRLLTIQLRPMDLGTVVVRMRLRGGQLEMSLHASREETATLLRKDGALLGDLLRSSGYQPELVSISADAAGGPALPPGAGGQNQDPAQRQAQDQADQSARRQPGARDDEPSHPARGQTHETHSGGADRSGVYL